MRQRPKILFVTRVWPLPVTGGPNHRVLNISRLLSGVGDVSFVIVRTSAADEGTVRLNKERFDIRMNLQTLPVLPDTPFHRMGRRLRRELDPRYLGADPRIGQADFAALLDLVKEFDVVWVHTIGAGNFCRIDRWPHSVLDVDDIPSAWYRSAAQAGRSPLRRILDLRLSRMWRSRERKFPKRFDVLTVCSEHDRQYFGGGPGVHVIPNGFYAQPLLRRPSLRVPRIGFIGQFMYRPNKEGLEWFLREVWPTIKSELPQTQFRVVGAGSDVELAKFGPDIVGLGWVDDPSDEIATWSAMIVPVRFGGGTRIKVAEGFSRKCPVVATTMGAFGYDVRNGVEILLADRPEDFASASIRLLRDPELRRSLAERAYQRFLNEWTWDSFEGTVRTVIQECIAKSDHWRSSDATMSPVHREPHSFIQA